MEKLGDDIISGPSGSEVREKGLAYKRTRHSTVSFYLRNTNNISQPTFPIQQAYQDSERKLEAAAQEDWPH